MNSALFEGLSALRTPRQNIQPHHLSATLELLFTINVAQPPAHVRWTVGLT
jgi:hypothetical protein